MTTTTEPQRYHTVSLYKETEPLLNRLIALKLLADGDNLSKGEVLDRLVKAELAKYDKAFK